MNLENFTRENLAWAAGIMDGEGTIRFQGGVKNDRRYGSLTITISQVHPQMLYRFKKAVGGLGTINGPYGPYQTNKQPYYNYDLSGNKIIGVIKLLWPWLGVVKRRQAKGAIRNKKNYDKWQKENPPPKGPGARGGPGSRGKYNVKPKA